jgi:hypothetical protein
MKRQLPRRQDVAPLIRLRRPAWRPSERRLGRALTIADLREIARRRTPSAAFDYTEGAAEAELSLARARQAFQDIEFHPAVLRDVSRIDTSWAVLGLPVSLPFGIAPTGFTRMMHAAGEQAGARAAAAAGIRVVDPWDHDDRGDRRRRPKCAALVSALHVDRSRPLR